MVSPSPISPSFVVVLLLASHRRAEKGSEARETAHSEHVGAMASFACFFGASIRSVCAHYPDSALVVVMWALKDGLDLRHPPSTYAAGPYRRRAIGFVQPVLDCTAHTYVHNYCVHTDCLAHARITETARQSQLMAALPSST